MKKYLLFALVLIMLVMSGCEGGGDGVNSGRGPFNGGDDKVVGKAIQMSDIKEFYYTVENINYDAFYQRYKFYAEDGKYYFFHETRERKDDYGPTTEEDATARGTLELSDKEWEDFYDLILDGEVRERADNADSGDSGPWYYLYWKGDKDKYQEFSFASKKQADKFVDYCVELAEKAGSEVEGVTPGLTEDDLCIELDYIYYHPGYGDMNGESHNRSLFKDDNGDWYIESSDCEGIGEPFITTIYEVSQEDIVDFSLFLQSAKFDTMENRPDSDLFMTDYSPWNVSIAYKDNNTGEKVSIRLEEYKEYSNADYRLLDEFFMRFKALEGDIISQEEEEDY
ncbi:MAG: hypothetical protein IKR23_09230 [Lachnospiraceae bacterium]|nr:hypothetical protein [Lachnospiraceae bacterium]